MATKIAADFTYTDQELLDLVREAIARISKYGGEWSLLGQDCTEADLGRLREWEQDLQDRISAATGPAIVVGRMRRASGVSA